MSVRTAALLALALALAPPAAAARAEDLASSPYYPLKVGSAWTYKAGDGGKFTMKVAKVEKVGDVNAARVEVVKDGKVESSELVAVRDDGVYRYQFENKKADPPIRFLKLPPKKDDAWKVESKSDGELIKGTFKMGEEDNVKVAAGTYKCVTVACDDLDAVGVKLKATYYFAENVGMVKQVIEAAGVTTVIELEKYEPAK
jgi:hypothetical protein